MKSPMALMSGFNALAALAPAPPIVPAWVADRKSTRLNSSHIQISYAVFCLKKITRNLRRAFATDPRSSSRAAVVRAHRHGVVGVYPAHARRVCGAMERLVPERRDRAAELS